MLIGHLATTVVNLLLLMWVMSLEFVGSRLVRCRLTTARIRLFVRRLRSLPIVEKLLMLSLIRVRADLLRLVLVTVCVSNLARRVWPGSFAIGL